MTRVSAQQPDQQPMLTVATIETRRAIIYSCDLAASELGDAIQLDEWDPSKYLSDIDGKRLIEEIVRRIRMTWTKSPGHRIGIAISLPGTLSGHDVIVSSSRLGIHQTTPAARLISEELEVPCKLFHDVECLAMGEDSVVTSPRSTTLVYIFVDEGVGSKIIINGETHVGAGVAGTLGRLTVQPDGSYYKELSARGPLEVYSSRPWVSENLVATYLSERGKSGSDPDALGDTAFRRAVEVAAGGDWRGIGYEHIADGIATRDPIAGTVLDAAARYLGLAINSVITIVHPHRIILGGHMITELPTFADSVISYARRYSWPLAWNSTEVTVSSLGRQGQPRGAVALWRSRFGDGA